MVGVEAVAHEAGAAVIAGFEDCCDVGACPTGADRHAITHRLGERDDVGGDVVQVTGQVIQGFPGELTGPVFDPSGTRLYFSSQRGTQADVEATGKAIGITYEVTGPFVVT